MGNRVALEAQLEGDRAPGSVATPQPSRVLGGCQPLAQPLPLLTQAGNQPGQFHFPVLMQPLWPAQLASFTSDMSFLPFWNTLNGLSVRAPPGTSGHSGRGGWWKQEGKA